MSHRKIILISTRLFRIDWNMPSYWAMLPNERADVWKRLFSREDSFMTRYRKLVSYFSGTVATALLGAAALTPAAAAPCTGPGAPTTTQTNSTQVNLIKQLFEPP